MVDTYCQLKQNMTKVFENIAFESNKVARVKHYSLLLQCPATPLWKRLIIGRIYRMRYKRLTTTRLWQKTKQPTDDAKLLNVRFRQR